MAKTNLNIAISSKGKEELISTLQSKVLTKTKEKMNDVKKVEQAIRDAWYGEDCDQYLKNFANARAAAYKKMEDLFLGLKKDLNSIEQDWASFRKRNVKAE